MSVEIVCKEDHSVEATITKVRNKYWLPKLPKMTMEIKVTCILRRKREKKKIEQEIGVPTIF